MKNKTHVNLWVFNLQDTSLFLIPLISTNNPGRVLCHSAERQRSHKAHRYTPLNESMRVNTGCLRSTPTWPPCQFYLALPHLRRGAVKGVRAEIFPEGAKSTFCLSFSGCWRCNANGRIQKINVQCCDNSCIQCFPCKKILHWANVCFSECGYFKTELAEF